MKTQRLKSVARSAALLCATALGTTALADDTGVFVPGTTTYDTAAEQADGIFIGNDNAGVFDNVNNWLVWESSDGSLDKGLTLTGNLRIADWGGTAERPLTGSLKISSGAYSANKLLLGNADKEYANAYLMLSGGKLTVNEVVIGSAAENNGEAELTLNGGTLVLNGNVTGAGSLVVGENGGTIEVAGDNDRTISTALTGSGTLTKTGSRELWLTGDVSGFTGKITVDEGEGVGSVYVGQTEIKAGETKDFAPDTTYYWTGAANDGNLWATPENWLVGGVAPTALPGDDSTVIFPAGADVTVVVNGAHTGNMTINRNVTLAAENVSGSVYLYLDRVGGTGTLTLKGASNTRWLRVGNAGDYAIDCDLEIKGHVYLANSSAQTLVVNGAFKGDGTVTCKGNNDAGIAFYGDTSAFSGYYEGGLRNNGNRDNTKFREDARGSALASWHFCGHGNTLATPFEVNGVTYQFGKLDTFSDTTPRLTMAGRTSTTIEVGALANTTSTVGGTLSDNSNVLRKVGATSTLNFTATEEKGTVEAKEGTTVILGTVAPAAVKFAGNSATIRIARSTTTTTIVTPAVVDDPDTEEDETADAVTETTTTDNIASSFVPGFTDALVGCQYEVAQETVDNVTYDVYTVLTDVATDSAGTTYDSVALALAAIAADETGTLTKVVTLAKSTTEAVTLPLDYSLALNGKTVGSVVGAAGVGVAYDEETQTWTTDDNSEAKWTGKAGDGLWETAGNWSTEFVPNEGTKVVFEDTATVFLSGCNNYDCGEFNIAKGKTVTLAPAEYNQANWPRVRVHGNITSGGECTLKLFRCGIDNAKDDGSVVEVRPTVTFENDGEHDSWMTGSFDLRSGFTGTGLFIAYGSNGSGRLKFTTGSITVPAGSVVDFRGGNYPTYGGSGGVISAGGLNGDGRVIIHTIPGNNVDRTYFQAAFKNAEKWTGTCELAGVSIGGIDAANYGNANSTVCFNGVSGYLRYSSGSTTEVGKVKTIEIGANGLTLGDGFSSGTFGYIIAADITGSGPIHFGTRHNDASVGQYFLTGSLDGFTGAIDFGSLDSYRPAVIIKDPTTYAPAVNDYGQIIVAAERTVTVSGAWNAPGGFVVLGNVNVASTGSITSTNGLCGNGTVTYTAIPATAPGCSAGGTSSGTNREIPAWTGTVVLPARTGAGSVPLAGLGRTGSKIVVNGITGTDANSIYLSDASAINGTVELKGDVKFTNGSTGANYTFAEVTGTGNMFLSATGSSGNPYYTYTFTKLNDYTGTINAVKTSDSKYAALAIGTVAVSEVVPGTPVVKLAANSNLTTDPAAIAVEVGGEATEATLFKAADGNLYVAVASVTVTPEEGDPEITPFATYEAAAAFADENSVTEFAVLYGDGAVNGWDYDSEEGTLTKNTTAIARVGATQYDTLAAAFDAATAGDTVVLFGTSAEAVTVAEGQTLVVDTTAAFTGTLSGAGTVDAYVATKPAAFSEWTGTFVVNWNLSGTSSTKAGVVLDYYGVSGSTVVVTQPLENFYFKHKDKANSADVQPAVYFQADVTQNDGYTYNYNGGLATIFAEVGMKEGKTFSTRGAGGTGNKYIFTKLSGFEGTLNVRSTDIVEINGVEVAETPAVGTKVVNATVAVTTASVTAKIADGYPLVVKEDGLYFDPVAQVGATYYNTLAEAITAANGGNTVTLVADTTDGYTLAAGDSFSIAWNGHTTGEIVKPTGNFYNTESYNDETGTTAYTCTAAIGILTIGQTVTPIPTAEAAFNGFMAQTTPAGSTLRFFTANPLAQLSVPCATYDAETLTYTKLTAVAQIGTGDYDAVQYPTLAEACAAAEQYGYDTVTLLVAKDSIEEELPEGWDYNDPETSETEFGTLTKEMTVTYNVWFVDTDGSTVLSTMQTVESGSTATKPAEDPVKEGKVFVAWTLNGHAYDFATPVTATITLMASWEDAPTYITVDTDGCNFKVDATTAAAITTATGVETTDPNFGKAAIAYVVGGKLEDGKVVIPTPTITVVNGKATVVYDSDDAVEGYTITCTLWSFALADANDSTKWTWVDDGAIGANLVDTNASGTSKFYKVTVSVEDAE